LCKLRRALPVLVWAVGCRYGVILWYICLAASLSAVNFGSARSKKRFSPYSASFALHLTAPLGWMLVL
jgi:hypothetical protein